MDGANSCSFSRDGLIAIAEYLYGKFRKFESDAFAAIREITIGQARHGPVTFFRQECFLSHLLCEGVRIIC